ncbi:MAG: hypothetical protein QW255_00920 [Candidatus Bilamarchaeaceae archaeon]
MFKQKIKKEPPQRRDIVFKKFEPLIEYKLTKLEQKIVKILLTADEHGCLRFLEEVMKKGKEEGAQLALSLGDVELNSAKYVELAKKFGLEGITLEMLFKRCVDADNTIDIKKLVMYGSFLPFHYLSNNIISAGFISTGEGSVQDSVDSVDSVEIKLPYRHLDYLSTIPTLLLLKGHDHAAYVGKLKGKTAREVFSGGNVISPGFLLYRIGPSFQDDKKNNSGFLFYMYEDAGTSPRSSYQINIKKSEGGIYVVNPGALLSEKRYGLLTLDESQYIIQLKFLP